MAVSRSNVRLSKEIHIWKISGYWVLGHHASCSIPPPTAPKGYCCDILRLQPSLLAHCLLALDGPPSLGLWEGRP